MYILKYEKLVLGDIILTRTNESDCIKIRQFAKSNYSHALIYQGNYSCLESHVGGVKAINVQRLIVKNENDIIVLRHKDNLPFQELIQIINKGKQKVAVSYASSRELYRSYVAKLESATEPNRQFCTRYVAQCYNETGHNIVDNADYCSPKDLEESTELILINSMVREASERELEIANEKNPVTETQEYTVYELFEKIRNYTGEDIQSFEQLDEHLQKNSEHDTEICKYLLESEYLKLADIEKSKNPFVYDFDLFKSNCPKEARFMNAVLNISGEYERIIDTKSAIKKYQLLYNKTSCKYFKIITELYEKLLTFCYQRLDVWEKSIEESKNFA